jgi:hypothetical protein
MVRLEGLVKGGAVGSYEACFMEHLRTLKDPLLDQMVDRCACQAGSVQTNAVFEQVLPACARLQRCTASLTLTMVVCPVCASALGIGVAGARRLRASVRTCLQCWLLRWASSLSRTRSPS